MPLFYFDVVDDCEPSSPDVLGTNLADMSEIPAEAQSLIANIARDRLPAGLIRNFFVSVRNDEGRILFTAELSLNSKWV
jgi:hypothetical protein